MANGHGGAREGAGRPGYDFLQRARKIGDPLQILQLYWDVATGKDMEQVVTDAGDSISTPAQVKDRLKAGELFLDRVIGKVPQGMEVTGADGDPFNEISTATIAALVEAFERERLGRSEAKP